MFFLCIYTKIDAIAHKYRNEFNVHDLNSKCIRNGAYWPTRVIIEIGMYIIPSAHRSPSSSRVPLHSVD